MATTWDDKMKCMVRETTHGFFRDKQYECMVDLPGNLCLSVESAVRLNVVSPTAVMRLAEKVPAVTPEIDTNMARLGFTKDRYTLFHGNLDEIAYRPDDRVGLLNADYMAQPTPFDLDLLQRTPFQEGAGVIATFHNPATRKVTRFMQEFHDRLHAAPASPYYRDLMRRVESVYQYITMDKAGRIIDDTSDRPKYLRWCMTLLACMGYGLRYHTWDPAMVMTYTPNGSYVKMSTFVLTNVNAGQNSEKCIINTTRWQSLDAAVDATLEELYDYYQV